MHKKTLMIFLTIITVICICGSVNAIDESTEIQKSYTDLSNNPLTTANQGDSIYGLIMVYNGVPFTVQNMNIPAIYNPQLTYQGTYQTSYDAGETWTTDDGSFNPQTGWQINIPGGNIYLLRQLFLVTGSNPDLTITEGAGALAVSSVKGGSTLQSSSQNTLRTNKRVKVSKTSHWKKTILKKLK